MYDNLVNNSSTLPTAIVTGGNRGIGLDITSVLVESGYFVIVGARNGEGFAKKFGNKAYFVETDVRIESAHVNLTKIAIERTGRLDTYINNAGYSAWRSIDQITDEFLTNILSTNLKGAFWGCKAAANIMLAGGTITNISSLAGKRGSANNAAYSASKFGMNGLTQSLSKELGPRQIRVNAICPVLIETEGLVDALAEPQSPAKGNPKKFIEDFAKANAALLRLPTGRDIGEMCVFLASTKASAISGQCMNVDCGVLPQ